MNPYGGAGRGQQGGGPNGGFGPGMRPLGPPGMMGPMGGMPGMADPEMLKLQREDMLLEQQSHELAMRYQRASKEDREKIKKEVTEVVNKQFEVRQQRRALELKRLEEELKRLRTIVEQRAKSRESLIEKRVADLIGPEEPGLEF
jgi:hypothetical protein